MKMPSFCLGMQLEDAELLALRTGLQPTWLGHWYDLT